MYEHFFCINNLSSYYNSDHYVLLYYVLYIDFIQDVIMPVFMAVTVTFLVLLIVKTPRVTHKVEHVFNCKPGWTDIYCNKSKTLSDCFLL